MALRALGKRNATLNAAAVAVARRLATSAQTAVRELTGAPVVGRPGDLH
jgi:hypothetical protein